MTNQAQQQPKKRSVGLTVFLAFLGLALFMSVGKALSYLGMFLGVTEPVNVDETPARCI